MVKNDSPKLLLVEDDPIAQLIFKRLISTLGHVVDIAGSGKKALEFLDQNSYAVIFMDLGLPDRSGLAIVEEIRTQRDLKMPIIALTAYTSETKRNECLKAGFNFFLEKPITNEKLKMVFEKFKIIGSEELGS